MQFNLQSDYKQTGDQPKAIEKLVSGINNNDQYQTTLGGKGSRKTFSLANVINAVQKTNLVRARNHTILAPTHADYKDILPDTAST